MAATAGVRCSTSEVFPLSAPRIAVDLLGGPGPAVVVDGVLRATERSPGLQPVLVGSADEARAVLAARGIDDPQQAGIRIAAASQQIARGEDPVRAVRSRRDATVRVAARLLRDGEVDATVSFGSAGAAVAAALFTLGRVPGMTRPPLAVSLPTPQGPVVLLDVGATTTATADALVQSALAGAAYAAVILGVPDPEVGLLSNSAGGDPLRREACERLAEFLPALGVRFEGNVAAEAVALGGAADVVVTDGFTGEVLLSGMKGAAALAGARREPGVENGGGAVLLGVNGVVVVGEDSSSPAAVAAGVRVAAAAVAGGLVPRLTDAVSALVAYRRSGESLAGRLPA